MKKEKLRKFLLVALFTGAFILLVFLIQTYGIEPLRSAVKEINNLKNEIREIKNLVKEVIK